jgi:hypothetical protein
VGPADREVAEQPDEGREHRRELLRRRHRPSNILANNTYPYKVCSAKCINWSIVTRARVPRHPAAPPPAPLAGAVCAATPRARSPGRGRPAP